ncbi:unnamed protein product [Camellia sinensis]
MLRVSDSPPRLVKIAEDDNEKFLLKLKKRIDRVGIDLPTIEVRFEHLNVDAEAYVGGRAFSTILNFSINLFEGFLNYLHVVPSRKKPLSILHDVSGIIKPGREKEKEKEQARKEERRNRFMGVSGECEKKEKEKEKEKARNEERRNRFMGVSEEGLSMRVGIRRRGKDGKSYDERHQSQKTRQTKRYLKKTQANLNEERK